MKPEIPQLSDKRLKELASRIKPVINFDGVRHYIKQCHLRHAYTWKPTKTKRAPELTVLKRIKTYHTCGCYGLFKPSIAEVIAQIPHDILSKVTEFEIVGYSKTANDLAKEMKALNSGLHVATTILYSR